MKKTLKLIRKKIRGALRLFLFCWAIDAIEPMSEEELKKWDEILTFLNKYD